MAVDGTVCSRVEGEMVGILATDYILRSSFNAFSCEVHIQYFVLLGTIMSN